MGNTRAEIMVGVFLVMGFLAFGWLALRLGEVPMLSQGKTYTLNAVFSNISGVRSGAEVQIAGVTVGHVRELSLDADNQALISMQLDRAVKVPTDSMASESRPTDPVIFQATVFSRMVAIAAAIEIQA